MCACFVSALKKPEYSADNTVLCACPLPPGYCPPRLGKVPTPGTGMGPSPPTPPLAVGENHTGWVVVVLMGFACCPDEGPNLLGGWVPDHPLIAVLSPGEGQHLPGGLVAIPLLIATCPWRQVNIHCHTRPQRRCRGRGWRVHAPRLMASPKGKQIHESFHCLLFPS